MLRDKSWRDFTYGPQCFGVNCGIDTTLAKACGYFASEREMASECVTD